MNIALRVTGGNRTLISALYARVVPLRTLSPLQSDLVIESNAVNGCIDLCNRRDNRVLGDSCGSGHLFNGLIPKPHGCTVLKSTAVGDAN